MPRIVFLAVISLFIFGFVGNTKNDLEKENEYLRQKVAQQDETIKKLLDQNRTVREIRKKFDKVRKLVDPIVTKLETVDEQLYNGKFIQKFKGQSPKPTVEEYYQGYIDLINHMEIELNEKS